MTPLLLAATTTTKATAPALVPPLPKGIATPLVNAPPLAAPAAAPQTAIALHAPWLTHGLAGLFVISAISLVILLALQTTKQEGLTGSIGGRVESSYRGRLGAEEQVKRWTGFVAVSFVVTAFILSLTGI